VEDLPEGDWPLQGHFACGEGFLVRAGPAGPAASQEEAVDRYRCRRWRDVTHSSEWHLGDGLSVRHDRRWSHPVQSVQASPQAETKKPDADFASELIASGATSQPVETVIAVLVASSTGVSINAAAKASGINYRTAQRIVQAASKHRQHQLEVGRSAQPATADRAAVPKPVNLYSEGLTERVAIQYCHV
jgi:hypothetical protein